jgi:hypothetical protein
MFLDYNNETSEQETDGENKNETTGKILGSSTNSRIILKTPKSRNKKKCAI